MEFQGPVKRFITGKGFVLVAHEGDGDVFVHYSAVQASGYRLLVEGQRVEFSIERGPISLQARNVVAL